ncbi:hypothetical protein BS47DRAFT_300 [Hydnum rufescens UP504]|uniref:Uncharacterized protein n=1 Tax=Hydnum rufescens UP504 TaxID=1448309 RepID=A0A9P6BBZ2_9AGAM|nr:hypothetical protein BS47DRAFT_300 [Hydnum rufescens UP504]
MQPSVRLARAVDTQPLKRLASAAGKCSVQSRAYGACILASYQDARRGMCEKEFLAFKECVQEVVRFTHSFSFSPLMQSVTRVVV